MHRIPLPWVLKFAKRREQKKASNIKLLKSNQPKYRNESIGRVHVHVCVFTSASAPFALYWSLYE